MKNVFLLLALLVLAVSGHSQNAWTQKSNLPGQKRYGAASSVLNDRAFVGLGTNGTVLKDWWEYDPAADVWTQKADFGGGRRYTAAAMTIGDGIYVGLGVSDALIIQKDWWQYNSLTNSWSQKSNLPSAARYGVATFVVNNMGYLCFGNEGSSFGPFTNEVWQYDASSDSWTSKSPFPAPARYGSLGLTINGIAYAGLGGIKNQDGTYSFARDFYQYDASNDTWTKKANYPRRSSYPVSFAIDNMGYVGLGNAHGISDPNIYRYDPVTNQWQLATSFPPGPRFVATGFGVNGKGYVGLGSTLTLSNYNNDLWEYGPGEKLSGSMPVQNNCSITFYLGSNQLIPHFDDEGIYQFDLYDLNGRDVQTQMTSDGSIINMSSNLPKGIYVAALRSQSGVLMCTQKVVVQ